MERHLLGVVAEHLVDGDVAVFLSAGAEKLRYITGTAFATNSKGETRRVDLDDIYDLAKGLARTAHQRNT